MMEAKGPTPAGPRDEEGPSIPFVFVPHGDPLPTEWMNRHSGSVRIPAVMVPRGGEAPSPQDSSGRTDAPPPPPPSGRPGAVSEPLTRPRAGGAMPGAGGVMSRLALARRGGLPDPDRSGPDLLQAHRGAERAMAEAPRTAPLLLAAWRPAPAPAVTSKSDARPSPAVMGPDDAPAVVPVVGADTEFGVGLAAGAGAFIGLLYGLGMLDPPPRGGTSTAHPVPDPGPSGSPPSIPPDAAAPHAPFPATEPERPAHPEGTHPPAPAVPNVLPGPEINSQKPTIHPIWGDGSPQTLGKKKRKQEEHTRNHKNYIPGNSILDADAQTLLDAHSGKGTQKGPKPRGQEGFREQFDTGGPIIGSYIEKGTKIEIPTTRGTIHYSKEGAHIVPARPRKEDVP